MSTLRIALGLICLIMFSISLASAGFKKEAISPSLPPGFSAPAETDTVHWLIYDNGTPASWLQLPDQYDDHYFNVRFTTPDSSQLVAAQFFFYQPLEDSLGTLPDVHILAWSSGGIVPNVPPNQPLDSLILTDTQIFPYPEYTTVDLSVWGLSFPANGKFHLGWEPFRTDLTDSGLAIIIDDGIPATTTSCEWWGGSINQWRTLLEDYGHGWDFFIRAQVETIAGEKIWLAPDHPEDFRISGLFPNPFNPQTEIKIQVEKFQWVTLKAYDFAGRQVQLITQRLFTPGVHFVNWAPQGLASGTYLIVMQSADKQASMKGILVR